MYLDRMIFPIETLGPGQRLVIWTAGCTKHCKGCANPELWETRGRRQRSTGEIAGMIRRIAAEHHIDGITISGGDPLEQAHELLELLDEIAGITEDILVYTGFTYDELDSVLTAEELEHLRSRVGVLIDGRYVEKLNTPDTALRGSSNQDIIFFKDELRERYEQHMAQGRRIQNVYMGSRLISVGIHDREQ